MTTSEPDDDLPCAVVVELLTDYLDDALSAADRTRLQLHLAECDGCDTVLQQFRTTIDVVGGLVEDDVHRLDKHTRTALLGAFRAWAAQSPRS